MNNSKLSSAEIAFSEWSLLSHVREKNGITIDGSAFVVVFGSYGCL